MQKGLGAAPPEPADSLQAKLATDTTGTGTTRTPQLRHQSRDKPKLATRAGTGSPAAQVAGDPAGPAALAMVMQRAKPGSAQGWSHSLPCNSSSPPLNFISSLTFSSPFSSSGLPLQTICLVLLALPSKALPRRVVNKTLLPSHCQP